MKIFYQILYLLSAVFFVMAIFGTSFTKPTFDDLSRTTLELSGFKYNYVSSADDKIDEMIYGGKKLELQMEKLKALVTNNKIDENKYKKEKNNMIENMFYTPLINVINYFFIGGFILASIIIFLLAMVFHIVYRGIDLRKRVKRLERLVIEPVI